MRGQTQATFSYEHLGPLRRGELVIRVKPKSVGTYVQLVDAQGAGLAMKYYKSGRIGRGAVSTYIPSKHLQYFDINANGGVGKWRNFKLDLGTNTPR